MIKKHLSKKTFKNAFDFIKKGNILFLAVAFLSGVVFNAVISSLANDIIMSAISELIGKKELENWKVGGMLIGKFLGTLINFVIVTGVLFVILFLYFYVKNYREYKKPPVIKPQSQPAPTVDEMILEQLREINKKLSNQPENNQNNDAKQE